MGKLMSCGICCMVLSIWAIIQLTLMGIFYKIEAVPLIHDAEAHSYEDLNNFIELTKKNYAALARNCWITAGIYLITLIISIVCIKKAKKLDKISDELKFNEELACSPKPPLGKKKKKIEE